MNKKRVILDSNVLISRALVPASVSAMAMRHAISHCQLLASQATVDELIATLHKKKFSPYLKETHIKEYIAAYMRLVEWVPILEHVRLCRDPGDDKFLDLAIAGGAGYIITGDADLLALHPFGKTRILPPAEFLKVTFAS